MTLSFFTNIKKSIAQRPALLLVICLSFILWMIFYPAYMSADSLVQYGQALSGVYEDWHPPIMAIVVHYTLLSGGGIAAITLLQTLLGCLGVYLLSKEILRKKKVSEKKKTWQPLYILIILLLPVSPLPFYLMNFLKDTWILIGLLWIAYIGLRTSDIIDKSSKQYRANYAALILLMVLVFITRYNAIVLLPVFFLLLFYNSKRLSKTNVSVTSPILWGILPFFIYTGMQKQLYNAFQIKEMHPENQVMALESVGVLVQDERYGEYIPYVKSNLSPNYKAAYYAGNVASVMNWEGYEKTLDQKTFSITDERIKKEYINLLLHAPLTLIGVKAHGFYNMLKPSTSKYWYHVRLDDNPYHLVQNTLFKKVRAGWERLANNIHRITLLSFISAEHSVWLIVNIALLFFLFLKKQGPFQLFIVLLIPLSYYFSYLLASTGDDFRFMYPATLLVQIAGLSFLFSKGQPENNKTTLTELN